MEAFQNLRSWEVCLDRPQRPIRPVLSATRLETVSWPRIRVSSKCLYEKVDSSKLDLTFIRPAIVLLVVSAAPSIAIPAMYEAA